MTKATKLLGQWLFDTLGGVFVENATLYMPGSIDGVTAEAIGAAGVVDGELIGYSITDGRIFPIATKEEVQCPYVVYDSMEVRYSRTKDGQYPDSVYARVLLVDKTQGGAERLADIAEAKLANAKVPTLSSTCYVESRKVGFDPGAREYLEELRISIEL